MGIGFKREPHTFTHILFISYLSILQNYPEKRHGFLKKKW